MPDYFEKLTIAVEFFDFASRFSRIEGWLSETEGYALLLAAAHGPDKVKFIQRLK